MGNSLRAPKKEKQCGWTLSLVWYRQIFPFLFAASFLLLVILSIIIPTSIMCMCLQDNADLKVSEKASEYSEILFTNPPSMNPVYEESLKMKVILSHTVPL